MSTRFHHPSPGPVIGVVGGSGGVGASTFAAVLAVVAGPSALVDLDPAGGGIDVVLGIDQRPGARWSGVRVAGGHLDPATLLDGLPRAGPCAVLAADTGELDAASVAQVVETLRPLGPVVLDLPRAPSHPRTTALVTCELVVVLARADVSGVVAAHAVAAALPGGVAKGTVARRAGRVDGLDATEVAALVGAPLLGELAPLGANRLAVDPARLPRRHARIAAGVLAGAAGGPVVPALDEAAFP